MTETTNPTTAPDTAAKEGAGRPSGLVLAGAGSLLAVFAFLGGTAVGHAWGGSDGGGQTQFNGPGGGLRQFPGQGQQGTVPGQGTAPGQGTVPGQGQQGTVPGQGQQGQGVTPPGSDTQNSSAVPGQARTT